MPGNGHLGVDIIANRIFQTTQNLHDRIFLFGGIIFLGLYFSSPHVWPMPLLVAGPLGMIVAMIIKSRAHPILILPIVSLVFVVTYIGFNLMTVNAAGIDSLAYQNQVRGVDLAVPLHVVLVSFAPILIFLIPAFLDSRHPTHWLFSGLFLTWKTDGRRPGNAVTR